ncbi:MAG: 2-amino-4-hydroxy-6-hydroxymethyldihydropteridine diphosphokinase [Phycisphaerae bacterium]|nr:2-amino-4-hydroxy-6-hydroxymethyldihydropteridine diphosphokinase [Phycisphaerae bacterium]
MTIAYIGLGSNLGDRKSFIHKALKMLTETKDIEVVRLSDILETAPLGGANQPDYLNAVAQIKTALTAEDLHKILIGIEASLGRTRNEKWSSRNIDLDILLFGDEIINSPRLTIPHSQMHLRSFVLKGLCQLDAELLHPVIKEPMKELAGRLNNADFVLNPELPQLISVAGVIGVGKTTLAKKLSDILGCKCILEPYDENPFLPDVYAGKKELALDSQLFFLTGRVKQLTRSALAAGQITISDYVFDKELIYAQILLDAEQLALYKGIYPPFSEAVVSPALVIYLTDSVQNCLERIHRRNRPYEQKIEPQFLDALSRGHEKLFADWKKCPVIRLSMLQFDFMRDDNVQSLANQIKSYIAIQ